MEHREESRHHDTIFVCGDCLDSIANGDGSHAVRARAAYPGMALYPAGLEYGFSVLPCDGCGSRLYGDRFDVVVLK